MERSFRLTIPTQRVLAVLASDPGAEHHGYDIGQQAGLASGTVHPILARLEAAGWVTSHWEQVDESAAGRRARRYYSLTESGAASAVETLAAVRPAPVTETFARNHSRQPGAAGRPFGAS